MSIAEEHSVLAALRRLLDAVLDMRTADDWRRVVAAFGAELRPLVAFDAGAVAVCPEPAGPCCLHGLSEDRPEPLVLPHPPRATAAALARMRPVHRPDRASTSAWGDAPGLFGWPPGAVLDVPFRGGTVILASRREHAFGTPEIGATAALSAAVGAALRRQQDLAARHAAEARLLESQDLALIGSLADGLAHDVNNLLTVIDGYAQLLLAEAPSSPARSTPEALAQIHAAVSQAAALNAELLSLARPPATRAGEVDLGDLVQRLPRLLARFLGDRVSLAVDAAPELPPISGNPAELRRTVLHLVLGAADALPAGGAISVAVSQTGQPAAPAAAATSPPTPTWVRLACRIRGTEVDGAALARALAPAPAAGDSQRLASPALAVAARLARQNRGHVSLASQAEDGATLELVFPAGASQAAAPIAPEARAEAPAGHRGTGETVLLVEDDAAVLRTLERVLVRQGYGVLTAQRGCQALDLARQHADRLRLLITDITMPDMNGRELAGTLRATLPGLRVLYVSGFAADALRAADLSVPGTAFLQKPVQIGTLLNTMRNLLERP